MSSNKLNQSIVGSIFVNGKKALTNIYTLVPAYCEFGYYEHPAITSLFSKMNASHWIQPVPVITSTFLWTKRDPVHSYIYKRKFLKGPLTMPLPSNHTRPGRLERLWRIHRSRRGEGPGLRQIHGAAGRSERAGEGEVLGAHRGEGPGAGQPVAGLTPCRAPVRPRRPRRSADGSNWYILCGYIWYCSSFTYVDKLCFQSCIRVYLCMSVSYPFSLVLTYHHHWRI